MILHILRKDWKLLWRPFLAFAFIQVLPTLLHKGSEASNQLEFLIFPATVVAMIAIVLMVIAVVQQDALPGLTQDWLIRPIRRADLLAAKLLFVGIVQLTILAADTLQIFTRGFSFREALPGALAHNLYFGVILTLPAMCVAAVTETLVEAVIACAAVFLVGISIDVFAVFLHGGSEYLRRPSGTSGIDWMGNYAGQSILICTTFFVLWTQYSRRSTSVSRVITVSGVICFSLCLFLPWQLCFALQEKLSPQPAAAASVALDLTSLSIDKSPTVERSGAPLDATHLLLQFAATGMPEHSVLKNDRSAIRLITSQGEQIYTTEGGNWILKKDATTGNKDTIKQGFFVPAKIMQRLSGEPFRVEVSSSLTLLSRSGQYFIAAQNGALQNHNVGRCQTLSGRSGAAIILRCVRPGNGNSCIHTVLQNPLTGHQVDSLPGWCTPDYSPGLERASRDPLSSFGETFFFHDPLSGTTFPTDEANLLRSQISISTFEPTAHFHRVESLPVSAIF